MAFDWNKKKILRLALNKSIIEFIVLNDKWLANDKRDEQEQLNMVETHTKFELNAH